MVGKLTRLPAETQKALQQLACLGNVAEITMLSIVLGNIGGAGPRGSLGGRPPGAGRAPGGLLQVRPRPRPGGRLFADPGRVARRGASPDRQAARGAHAAGEARGGDLRDRQSAQPRRRLDHLTRGARAAGRAQPDRGQARQGVDRLRLGAHLSHRRRGAAGRTTAGSAGTSSIFALELHRAECEFLTGALAAAEQRLTALSTRAANTVERATRRVPARGSVHDPRSERAAPSPSVSTTSGISASTGRRIRRKRKRDANTSGSGRSSGAARSRTLIDLP